MSYSLATVATTSFFQPSFSKPSVRIQTRAFSWLDHAERHFKNGYIQKLDDCYGVDSHLMYLALFSHVGMFD